MEMNKYIDYNDVLSQLLIALFERDWDLIVNLILTLQHLIALELELLMLLLYLVDLINEELDGD